MAGNASINYAIRAVNEAKRALQDASGDLGHLKGEAEKADGAMSGLRKAAGGVMSALGDMAKIAGGFVIGQGLLKLPGMIGGATSAAAELEQSIGGVQSIFGDSSEAILAWGRDAHESAGLSQDAFNKLAVPLGAMLKNAGRDMGDVTDKTLELTQRAADMAATFGGPVEDAVAAIAAMMRGETDPIEKYGVSIKAADVTLRALADTGKTTEEALTPLELQNARLALLNEQTASSVGQFAREADTAAGKSERLKAKQENLAASLGTQLLPLQVKWTQLQVMATDVLTNKLVPAVQIVADWLGRRLGPVIAEMIPRVQAVALQVRDLAMRIGEFAWEKLQEFASWTTGTLIPALQEAAQHIRGHLMDAWATLQPIIDAVMPTLRSIGESLVKLPGIAQDIASAMQPLVAAFDAGLGWLANNEAALIGTIAAIAAVVVGAYVPAVIAWVAAEYAKAAALLASAAAFAIANAPLIAIAVAIGLVVAGVVLLVRHWDDLTARFPVLQRVADAVRSGLTSFLGWITGTFVPAVQKIVSAISDAVDDAVAFVRDNWPEIQAAFEPPLKIIAGFVEFHFNVIKVTIETILGVIKGLVDVFMGVFTGDWDRAWGGVKEIVSSIWDGIKGIIGAAIEFITTDLVPNMLTAATALGGALKDGLIAALTGAAGLGADVANAVAGVLESAINSLIDRVNGAVEFTISNPFGPDVHVNPPDIPHVSIPRLARGMWEVPGPRGAGDIFPALLAPGEMVIPQRIADRVRSGGERGGSTTLIANITIEGNADERVLREALDQWWEATKDHEFGAGALQWGQI